MPNVSENAFEPLLHLMSLYLDYNHIHHLHNKSLALQGKQVCVNVCTSSSYELFGLHLQFCLWVGNSEGGMFHVQLCLCILYGSSNSMLLWHTVSADDITIGFHSLINHEKNLLDVLTSFNNTAFFSSDFLNFSLYVMMYLWYLLYLVEYFPLTYLVRGSNGMP